MEIKIDKAAAKTIVETCDALLRDDAKPTTSRRSGIQAQFHTTEDYYIERDLYLRYVAFVVNPERLKAGLAVISDSIAARCFDIIGNQTYRAKAAEACRPPTSDFGGTGSPKAGAIKELPT